MIVFDVDRVGPWVCDRTGGAYYPGAGAAIGLEKNGELIAGVFYDNYNGRSICMHVAAVGKNWLNREYLFVCFDYPFRQLKVNKILGFVDSTNHDALKFDKHLGFEIETVIKDAGPHGDLIILSMTNENCRWLNGRKKQSTPGS